MAGLYVLYRRRVSLAEIVRNNRWMAIFMVYCFLAVFWSDFPLVALKRWVKDLGLPIMVLVILTEENFDEALTCIMMRLAYVILPVSALFIKYFPYLGRSFDSWTGASANTGITVNKNTLGLDLFILGVFLLRYFLKVWRQEKCKERRNELIQIAFLAYGIGWLFHMAQSSTSLVSFLIASTLILFLNSPRVNPRYIGTYLLAAAIIGVVAEDVFGIYSGMVQLLGKSPTLSGRTVIWQYLMQVKIDPILGSGYESFWLGEHIKQSFWPGWAFVPNEAHNAYLDTYLNLGLAGLFLLLGWFLVIYLKARRDLIAGQNWGRFRMAFLLASLFYGWTEAAFRSLDPVYFVIFLIAVDYPRAELATSVECAETEPQGPEMMLAVAKASHSLANNQTGVVMNLDVADCKCNCDG
ncbi:MAG TPA: O-antigen ligase family protein [Verrucomicrobiae bacterium]|nr:O-antigen ligase family protein [Verrucomicrobiae bacterium]